MRIAAIGEFVLWILLAILVALFQSELVLFGLQATYGSIQDTPVAVLEKLAIVSPAFPSVIGLAALVRLATLGMRLQDVIGFQWQELSGDLKTGLMVGALCVGITFASLSILSRFVSVPPLGEMPAYYHLYFATVGAVLPGFFEEVYFRRLLMYFGRTIPISLSVVISAAAFAMWHIGSPAYLFHTFVLGLIWGALFYRKGRLFPVIIAHCCANSLFGFALFFGLSII
jgi:membrane protease YdiL (CAAX protease family)